MENPETRALGEELRRSTAAVEKAAAGLDDEAARAKMTPEGWSVLETIEHVTLVDRAFAGRLDTARRVETPIVVPEREAMILRDVPRRVARFSAPPAVIPQGRYQTLSEALNGLRESRTWLSEKIAAHEGELRVLEVKHPLMGPMSGYEAFLVIAAHGLRHANQIEEIRAGGTPVGNAGEGRAPRAIPD